VFRRVGGVGTGGDCAIMWAVYSGEVGGEVDTRYRMCHGGWEVWVQGGTVLLYGLYTVGR